MQIEFRTKALGKVCNDSKVATKKLGSEMAKKLRVRLDAIRAASNLGQLAHPMPGRFHELKGDRKGQISADLVHPYRLLLEPVEDPRPVKDDGGLDWSSVTAVRVIEIEDTHG